MAYIIQRQNRFYVVAYDGIKPTTGRERRRWHPAGHSRADADAIRARLEAAEHAEHVVTTDQLTLGRYLTERWMPRRRQRLAPTTARRYQWMIDNYIDPALGSTSLRSLQAEHLDRFYSELLAAGGERAGGLAPKTVYDVHVIIRAALKDAQRQHLVPATSPTGRSHPDLTPVSAQGPSAGPRISSPISWDPPATSASTPLCTSPRPRGCAAVRSPDCAGVTGTGPRIACRSPGAVRSSVAAPPKSR